MVISGFNLKVVAVQLSERDEMASSNGTVNGTPNGTVPKRVRIKERRLRALELRMRGLTYADIASQVGLPEWVEVDAKKMTGVLKSLPDREDILPDINENLVVELYSK